MLCPVDVVPSVVSGYVPPKPISVIFDGSKVKRKHKPGKSPT